MQKLIFLEGFSFRDLSENMVPDAPLHFSLPTTDQKVVYKLSVKFCVFIIGPVVSSFLFLLQNTDGCMLLIN
jgi:hypothetical protein